MAKIGARLADWLKEVGTSFTSELIAKGVLARKESGKTTISPEAVQQVAEKLKPYIFGLGVDDEALLQGVLPELQDRRYLKVANFLNRQSEYDQRKFILTLAHLPEPKRVSVLAMYSRLSVADMRKLACATGLMTGTAGPLNEALEKIKKEILPWITASTQAELRDYPRTAKLVRRLKRHTQEKERNLNWFARLHR